MAKNPMNKEQGLEQQDLGKNPNDRKIILSLEVMTRLLEPKGMEADLLADEAVRKEQVVFKKKSRKPRQPSSPSPDKPLT